MSLLSHLQHVNLLLKQSHSGCVELNSPFKLHRPSTLTIKTALLSELVQELNHSLGQRFL